MKPVVVSNISKHYASGKNKIQAVKDISFEVEKGELFGIIGPDGSGKTSLFRMLTTLLLPDAGSATIDGFDVVKDYRQIRKRIGYMPGKFSLYEDLSVEENLEFFATIFNTSVDENYGLVKDIYSQIEPFRKRKAGKLSGGMKQKLALSCALIHYPSVLFLDEPTTGVDAVSRKEFWEMLSHLKKKGITILVSTPYMDEAGLCDRIALVQHGEIMTINTPDQVVKSFGKQLVAVKSADMLGLLKYMENNELIENAYAFGEYHHAVMKNSINTPELERIIRGSFDDAEIKEAEPGIEDCFISLMRLSSS